jgi:hypothetical protein
MSRLRKVVAQRAVESMQSTAQLTTVVEVDVTRVAALRDKVKSTFLEKTGNKLSFLPFANPAGCVWLPDEGYDSRERYSIKDHCNGLLLIDKYVVNPATRHWDALPAAPPGRVQFIIRNEHGLDPTPLYEIIHTYLVFDPTVSPHYQVLRVCALSRMGSRDDLKNKDSAECPSSSWTFNVLSSRTGCWDETRFVREGDAAGTFAEVRAQPQSGAVYWRGALYVHCESHFLLRCVLNYFISFILISYLIILTLLKNMT